MLILAGGGKHHRHRQEATLPRHHSACHDRCWNQEESSKTQLWKRRPQTHVTNQNIEFGTSSLHTFYLLPLTQFTPFWLVLFNKKPIRNFAFQLYWNASPRRRGFPLKLRIFSVYLHFLYSLRRTSQWHQANISWGLFLCVEYTGESFNDFFFFFIVQKANTWHSMRR